VVVGARVELVQVDALVTDKDGHPVPGLGAGDFEVLEDGRPQAITHCEYVSTDTSSAAGSAAAPQRAREPREDASRFRRIVALVVDDAGLAQEDSDRARRAIADFVDAHMGPLDTFAIARTALSGTDVLGTFTADKRLLHAAIAHLKATPAGFADDSLGAPCDRRPVPPELAAMCAMQRQQLAMRRRQRTHGTLEAVAAVVEALSGFPGRKALVLFSDRLSLRDETDATAPDSLTAGPLRRMIEQANRASVVIYTVNMAGMPSFAFTASQGSGDTSRAPGPMMQQREEALAGLALAADETGGLFLKNANDPGDVARQIMTDLAGYYLIGYVPPEGEPRRRHRVQVRVKQAGLRVRARTGVYGPLDPPAPSVAADAGAAAPAGPPLEVDAMPLFGYDPQHGATLRLFLHVAASGLTFEPEPSGASTVALEIGATALDVFGAPVKETGKAPVLHIPASALEQTRREGLAFELSLALPKPAIYRVRALVRDRATRREGAKLSVVEVPDVGRGWLALSGVALGASRQQGLSFDRFSPGAEISYAAAAYNVHVDPKSGGHRLESRVTVFHEGREVFAGEPVRIESAPAAGVPRKDKAAKATIPVDGGLRLTPAFPPGAYTLQVVVTDLLAGEKERTAAQSVDFEVR
jgi:VWFA-related protein